MASSDPLVAGVNWIMKIDAEEALHHRVLGRDFFRGFLLGLMTDKEVAEDATNMAVEYSLHKMTTKVRTKFRKIVAKFQADPDRAIELLKERMDATAPALMDSLRIDMPKMAQVAKHQTTRLLRSQNGIRVRQWADQMVGELPRMHHPLAKRFSDNLGCLLHCTGTEPLWQEIRTAWTDQTGCVIDEGVDDIVESITIFASANTHWLLHEDLDAVIHTTLRTGNLPKDRQLGSGGLRLDDQQKRFLLGCLSFIVATPDRREWAKLEWHDYCEHVAKYHNPK